MVIETADIKVSAEFSDDKKLRFLLKKTWDINAPAALFVLLNPSKADIVRVDNTFCNIINQAANLGYGEVRLVNLFPVMATEQKDLKGKFDLGEAENFKVLERELKSVNDVFIAWGSEHKKYKTRKTQFENTLRNANVNIRCWYDKHSNYPKHLRIVGKDWKLDEYKFVFSVAN